MRPMTYLDFSGVNLASSWLVLRRVGWSYNQIYQDLSYTNWKVIDFLNDKHLCQIRQDLKVNFYSFGFVGIDYLLKFADSSKAWSPIITITCKI